MFLFFIYRKEEVSPLEAKLLQEHVNPLKLVRGTVDGHGKPTRNAERGATGDAAN
jgi:hypothetical protein